MREEIFHSQVSGSRGAKHPDLMRITKSWASSQMPDWIPLWEFRDAVSIFCMKKGCKQL